MDDKRKRKVLKIFLIIVGITVGIIILDTVQALAFNNNPILGTQTKCRSKNGLFVTTYHCNNGRNITKLKDSTCSFEEMCKETKNIDYVMQIKDIDDLIIKYFSQGNVDISNYAYSYVDEKNNKIVVGLIDVSEEKQNEFIDNVFTDCCGEDYIRFIKEHKLIMFKESKEVFEAKIIEVNAETIMVKISKSSGSFKTNDRVIVKIPTSINETNVTYAVGNKVRITFNGIVLTSNPAQIGAYTIEQIK